MWPFRIHSSRLLLVGIALAGNTAAQCATQWLPGQGIPGTNGQVFGTTNWDPDGPGPTPPVVVVAGAFTIAGTVEANGVATYDPVSGAWSALGTGVSYANCVTTLPSGDLVVGGVFTTAGGLPANNIARWNGTTWSALGTGMDSPVNALTTLPNGDLVAGGSFTTAGGGSVNRIARWNGTS